MKKDELIDLQKHDPFAEPSFIFGIRGRERSSLITRLRGTVVEKTRDGFRISAWQKSIYRFGGLYREVPIAVRLRLSGDGSVQTLDIDRSSRGSQGKSCDFACIEAGVRDKLLGRELTDFDRLLKSSGDAGCLHVFEILGGAASFFGYLVENKLRSGAEQEILKIKPRSNGIFASDTHSVLGKTAVTEIELWHNAAPSFGKGNLPARLDCSLDVRFNGESVSRGELKTSDFAVCYSRLNRAFTRAYNAEKRCYGVSGRQRFSNLPSLVGLFCLALSHGGMRGTVSRAYRLENILIFLQTGEGREGCVGFRGGLNMNQRYLIKGAAAASLVLGAAIGVPLRRRSALK